MSPNHILTKTDYIQYLDCREELWLQKNRPEQIPPHSKDALFRFKQGNLVDKFAQEIFDGPETTFQKPARAGLLLAIADIVTYDAANDTYYIYEVKSSTKVKPEHIHDVAFQRVVFEQAGYRIGGTYLGIVNKHYITDGPIDPKAFLLFDDVTEQVSAMLEPTKVNIEEALSFINGPAPEKQMTHCSKKLDCPFVQMHYPDLPDYSIWDIARISKSNLQELAAMEVFDIKAIPDAFKLSPRQRMQVNIAKTDEIIIDKKAIAKELGKLEYPLYFLDYETLAYVFPVADGLKPYQQMVFQYSLHVLPEPDGAIRHKECLLKDATASTASLLAHLQENMDISQGTVIVWNQSFEKSRNKEMAAMFPEFAPFLKALNDKVYDLAKPFQQLKYVDPGFKGKASIKNILPVLVPDLSYQALDINNGLLATISWHKMATEDLPSEEKQKIYNDLLAYCHLDTLAMVRIFEVLNKL